jgi:hypothetical protein
MRIISSRSSRRLWSAAAKRSATPLLCQCESDVALRLPPHSIISVSPYVGCYLAGGKSVLGFLLAAIICLGSFAAQSQTINSPPPTVGMEGRVQIMIPGALLEARPVEPKAKLLLRVADARPHGTLFDYDLRFIGFVPGKYDLRNYLIRKDGSSTNDLPKIPVEVTGLLPAKHRGELVPQDTSTLPSLGGYKGTLVAVAIVWAVLFVPLWLTGRKPKIIELPKAETKPLTLADRLRPLVIQAVEGKLSRDELAQLERMLLNYWREKLGLRQESMIEAVQKLRQHPEGGELLREMENWLHRPPGSAKVDVNALLAPYREPVAAAEPVQTHG